MGGFCSGSFLTNFFGLIAGLSLVVIGFFFASGGFSSCFTILSPSFLATLTGSLFASSFVEGFLVVLATLAFFTVVVDFFVVFFAALVFTFGAFVLEGSFFVVFLTFWDVFFVVTFF